MKPLLSGLILVLTVGLALWRPRAGPVRVQPYLAALLGAALCVLAGLVSLHEVATRLRFLLHPMATLVSMMAITMVVGRVGVFRTLSWWAARKAGGDARKLYGYLFAAGTLTGALFTNDAAVLIFTPLIFLLVEQIADESWSQEGRIAFYYAALYVANLVGLLVISNPINLVVADIFDIGFGEYAAWMFLPGVVSIVTSYVGLRIAFRHSLPTTYRIPEEPARVAGSRAFRTVSAGVLCLTLAGLFTESLTGLRTSYVAMAGAAALVIAYRALHGGELRPIARGIGWDVVAFVAGIFIVASAIRNAGATQWIGDIITSTAQVTSEPVATLVTALLAGSSSAVMNNHPVAQIMALTIEDLPYGGAEQRVKVLAALIGGDLGPKMLPLGSLAALLWFRLLRNRGVELTYRRYIAVGVPITLAATLLATATLVAEHLLLGG